MNGLKRWICPECADEGYIFAENQEKAKKELVDTLLGKDAPSTSSDGPLSEKQ